MEKLFKSEKLYWNDKLSKFESYSESVKEFCNEN